MIHSFSVTAKKTVRPHSQKKLEDKAVALFKTAGFYVLRDWLQKDYEKRFESQLKGFLYSSKINKINARSPYIVREAASRLATVQKAGSSIDLQKAVTVLTHKVLLPVGGDIFNGVPGVERTSAWAIHSAPDARLVSEVRDEVVQIGTLAEQSSMSIVSAHTPAPALMLP